MDSETTILPGCQQADGGSGLCETIPEMPTFLLWCILFVLCWPLALLALFIYPLLWVLLLPLRLLGVAVGAVLELVWFVVTLPMQILRRLTR